jgi:hypothetical protein
VAQGDDDGGDGPLVARREVVGQFGDEGEFVADLWLVVVRYGLW